MRVLVTGGAGFIGSNFVHRLRTAVPDAEIVALDDLSVGLAANLAGASVELIQASVLDDSALRRAMKGTDAVVHLGALGSVPRSVDDPLASHAANTTGTLHVLEAAREVGAHVVFASSSSVYGANAKLPKSELDWTRPMSPYAASKLGAESYVLAYQATYGLPALAFRFFNVYGPRQRADHVYAAVIPKFIDAALSGKPLTVHGDGLQTRDFTFVETVCETLCLAVTRQVTVDAPINLAYGSPASLLEVIDIIAQQTGIEPVIEHIEPRTGDVRESQADGILLRRHFTSITPTPLVEGIARTVDWFRATRVVSSP